MIFFSQFNLFSTHSKEAPSLERNECAFGVMLNNFEVCSEDASRLERLRIDEFFCLKLKFDPSNRMEPVVMCNSVLDIFKSDAKMSLSVSASERNFYFKIHSQNTKKKKHSYESKNNFNYLRNNFLFIHLALTTNFLLFILSGLS